MPQNRVAHERRLPAKLDQKFILCEKNRVPFAGHRRKLETVRGATVVTISCNLLE